MVSSSSPRQLLFLLFLAAGIFVILYQVRPLCQSSSLTMKQTTKPAELRGHEPSIAVMILSHRQSRRRVSIRDTWMKALKEDPQLRIKVVFVVGRRPERSEEPVGKISSELAMVKADLAAHAEEQERLSREEEGEHGEERVAAGG